MNKNLRKAVIEINNLVNGFVRQAQVQVKEITKSILIELNNEFEEEMKKDAMSILKKLSDEIWKKEDDKCYNDWVKSGDQEKGYDQPKCKHYGFGNFKIDVLIVIKNGNVSLGFVLNPNQQDNIKNNKDFAAALNKKIRLIYNTRMTKFVKKQKNFSKINLKKKLTEFHGRV